MRMLIARLAALSCLAGAARAQKADDLLAVEQAFALSAHVATPGDIGLHWTIVPAYHLYRSRIKARSAQAGVALGAIDLPDGTRKHDEFLGEVEIYHGSLDARLPYTLSDTAARAVTVTVIAQGCHETDPKVCYPPHPTTLTLDLQGTVAAVPSSTLATGSQATAALPRLNLSADAVVGVRPRCPHHRPHSIWAAPRAPPTTHRCRPSRRSCSRHLGILVQFF